MKISLEYILFLSCFISAIYYFIKKCNNLLIFDPTKSTMETFELLCKHNNVIHCQMKTPDGEDLYGILYNECKIPTWDDTIIFYSHGNSGCIEQMIEYNIRLGDVIPNLCLQNFNVLYSADALHLLSQYGSVFIYDYRGYGVSSGTPSEKGMYIDIKCAWNFLIKKKSVKPENIIVYGFSLGCVVSTHLCAQLCLCDEKLPKSLILEAPISCIKDMAKYHYKLLHNLVLYKFDNIENLKIINNSLPIYILHSKNDERVPYSQAVLLSKYINNNIINIDGTHNSPIYNTKVRDLLSLLSNKIINKH